MELELIELNDILLAQLEEEALLLSEKKLAESTGPLDTRSKRRFVRDMAKLAGEMEDTERKIAKLKAELWNS